MNLIKPGWLRSLAALTMAGLTGFALWSVLVPAAYQPPNVVFPDGGYVSGGAKCRELLREKVTAATPEGVACSDAAMAYRLTYADLVQQWRAASAVEAANKLNHSQIRAAAAQSVIGLFTLLAALFAALYAKRAAEEAGRATGAARENTEAAERASNLELRAYVGLESYEAEFIRLGFGKGWEHYGILEVANFGRTPTKWASIRRATVITNEEPNFDWLTSETWEDLGVIAQDRGVEYRAKSIITRDDLRDLKRPDYQLVLVGEVKYADAFQATHLYRFVLTSQTTHRWETVWSEEKTLPQED